MLDSGTGSATVGTLVSKLVSVGSSVEEIITIRLPENGFSTSGYTNSVSSGSTTMPISTWESGCILVVVAVCCCC